MAAAEHIHIELVYADPAHQRLDALEVAAGTTLLEAFRHSKLRTHFEALTTASETELSFGIFGERIAEPERYILKDGDRIEIYRPLKRDPKQARLARARQQ